MKPVDCDFCSGPTTELHTETLPWDTLRKQQNDLSVFHLIGPCVMLKCLVKQFPRLPRTSPALGSQSCLSCFMLAFLLTPSISRTKDTWVVRKLACSLSCPSHSRKLMVDVKLCKHLSSLQSIGLCILPIASSSLQWALFSNSASLSPQPSLQHLQTPKYF